jgi:hypothetical protein
MPPFLSHFINGQMSFSFSFLRFSSVCAIVRRYVTHGWIHSFNKIFSKLIFLFVFIGNYFLCAEPTYFT